MWIFKDKAELKNTNISLANEVKRLEKMVESHQASLIDKSETIKKLDKKIAHQESYIEEADKKNKELLKLCRDQNDADLLLAAEKIKHEILNKGKATKKTSDMYNAALARQQQIGGLAAQGQSILGSLGLQGVI